MQERKTKASAGFVMLLGVFSYFSSYITRVNLSVTIEALRSHGIFPKDTVALATTCNVIVYGAGLIIAGFLTRKFKPKTLLVWSLAVAALMNVAVPFAPAAGKLALAAAWSVNGFAQALMWPALVQVFLTHLNGRQYDNAILYVSVGSSAGYVLTYLTAPLLFGIGDGGWKLVFLLPAAVSVVCAVLWLSAPFGREMPQVKKTDAKADTRVFTPMIAAVAFAIVLHGMLRDGITTWMPTYINDNFHLGANISILTGVALPIFGMLSSWLGVIIIRKLRNPILAAMLIFGTAAVFCVVLGLLGRTAPVAVFSMAVIVGAMHGVNMMLVSMVPKAYAYTGKGALLTGVLNAFTFAGSAVSIYGVVLFSDAFGWNATVFLWAGAAALGGAVCLLILPAWNKQFGGNRK